MVDLSELSQDEFNVLYHALGSVVVNWNFVEHPLDYCVALIYHSCGGKTILKKYENEVPVSMTGKTDLLEKSFKKIDILLPFKDEGLLFVKHSLALSKKRNDMIHMRLMGKNPDGSFLFDKIDYKKMHESRLITYTINQLYEFGKEISDLGDDLGQFCKRLLQQFARP
jgi:hypothetical protein